MNLCLVGLASVGKAIGNVVLRGELVNNMRLLSSYKSDLQYYCGDAVERPKGLVVGISELMLWFQSSWNFRRHTVSAVLSETRGIL